MLVGEMHTAPSADRGLSETCAGYTAASLTAQQFLYTQCSYRGTDLKACAILDEARNIKLSSAVVIMIDALDGSYGGVVRNDIVTCENIRLHQVASEAACICQKLHGCA